ncbi:MAG TPA: biotin--[acetyl-CoA-carboxylase] ligase [Rhizomicrobium sp.]|nr:biotin--[acetyl-CoA-carboxylase] ligase [Rhizomicrobium sp.]
MTGWPSGYGLKRFDEIDSTNEEARRLSLAGEQGPIWLTAKHQTAGRGRRGRNWETPHDNLAATLLIHPVRRESEWPQLSFVAAIAASDMAAFFAPHARIALKWPNDVLADGRKLAGILLENAHGALAIGIGVNLRHHPADTEFPATSLAALGGEVPSADEALARLAADFAKWYEVWSVQGFAAIRDAWLARAHGLGTRIRARLVKEERSGMFEGIDESGALLLNEGFGRLSTLPAADIFFG